MLMHYLIIALFICAYALGPSLWIFARWLHLGSSQTAVLAAAGTIISLVSLPVMVIVDPDLLEFNQAWGISLILTAMASGGLISCIGAFSQHFPRWATAILAIRPRKCDSCHYPYLVH